MRVAYLTYGSQSGVTAGIAQALRARGHEMAMLDLSRHLALRSARTRLPRPTPQVLGHLAAAALRFGRLGLEYRYNTTYAFDAHTARAGELVDGCAPAVVLQNGALFAPGSPPRRPYVLFCDHTHRLAREAPDVPELGLSRPPDYGRGWHAREVATYGSAAAIATFSTRVRESLIRDYDVSPEAVHVVGAGANVFPEQVERRHDGKTIVFIGRHFRRKGGLVLLDAFARVRRAVPGARLIIAGPCEAAELFPMPEGATNLGALPLAAVPGLLSTATVFTLPTLLEPFGLAFLDAMACGVACVGTRIEAVPEILDEGETGLLVPPADPGALAEALIALLRDPARADAMGAKGRRKIVERELLWPEVGKKIALLVEKAAPSSRQAA